MATDELYEEEWLEFYDHYLPSASYRGSFAKLLQVIQSYNQGARDVLEIACGTGKYTRLFVQHGFHIKGIDISEAAIERAKRNVPGTAFVVGDMTKLKEPAAYDVVVCLFESFRYHKSQAQALGTLKRIRKALRPGGVFCCDFGDFPAGEGHIHNEIKVPGKLLIRDETLISNATHDTRKDRMQVFERGWFRKTLIKDVEIKRDPLLRISTAKMLEMMQKAGFTDVRALNGFRPGSAAHESILFSGKNP